MIITPEGKLRFEDSESDLKQSLVDISVREAALKFLNEMLVEQAGECARLRSLTWRECENVIKKNFPEIDTDWERFKFSFNNVAHEVSYQRLNGEFIDLNTVVKAAE